MSDADSGIDPGRVKEVFHLVQDQDDPLEERVAKLRKLLAEVDANVTHDVVDAKHHPKTPLHFAVEPARTYHSAIRRQTQKARREMPIIRALLECGADPNIATFPTRPFEHAIPRSDDSLGIDEACEAVRMLREHGAKPHAPLARFCRCHPKMMQLLLALGLDPEEKDKHGNTALHATVAAGSKALAELLLAHGARTDVPNEAGHTALKMRRMAEEMQLPCNVEAIRGAVKELGLAASFLAEGGFANYEELAARMHHAMGDGVPKEALALVAATADALGGTFTRYFEGDQVFKETFFHHGDVVIDGSFYTNEAFIVTGELRVRTVVSDCGPDSYVVVGGNVHAEAVDTDGEFYIGGELNAAQYVYGYYNDNIMFAETIRTPLLIADDHAFLADFEVEHLYNYEVYDANDRSLLVDECFDEGGLSRVELQRIVAGGGSIFRKG